MWSNDRPYAIKSYKIRKFMKTDFIQYTLTRIGDNYIRTQADYQEDHLVR